MDRGRETYWQEQWLRAGLSKAIRQFGREKFFALVAYPGASGFLHVGHLRGLTFADALHRYHRMLGHQVFFPTGTHASGLPAVAFAQKVKDLDPTTIAQLEDNAVPPSEWAKLEDPAYAARFLGRGYLEVFRRLGLLIDETAYLTTIDDDYQAFIQWQFRRLQGLGTLVQAPHFASVCPVCGPVAVDPAETDLSSGGDAETVRYTTIPFPLTDGRILLTATLRPETLFGVTNLWIPASEPLVVWHHLDRKFLVSRKGAQRLVDQHGGRIGHPEPSGDLEGRTVHVPITNVEVPIFPSTLVEPNQGTGVVMSVPGHAPADWLGLQELSAAGRSRIGDIPIIIETSAASGLSVADRELLSGSGPPAERAARTTKAHSLRDTEALEEATERLYRLEFVRGRMRPGLLGGVSVAQARGKVAEELERTKRSFSLQEFSKPVICRNGHEVVIRRVPDQWFLKYGDAAWKDSTRELIGRMSIRPAEFQAELVGILDWFQDRPCTRKGRWLGTPFPLDPSWIIEPIADSTFYPAYFPIRRFVTAGKLTSGSLTDAFFDFVYLGRGDGEPSIERSLQEEIRSEFTYWYPLDANIGGKEHKRVHFPVFLYTHAKLLPPELQPRSISVHWWITDKAGSKISKKQVSTKGGGIPPIRQAFERWGADALRLFYAQAAAPFQDIEWDGTLVDTSAERLAEIERMAVQLAGIGPDATPELERWLEAELHDLVRAVRTALEEFEFRDVAEIVYARIPGLFRRYIARGGAPGETTGRLLDVWIRLMSPITPHAAEELGQRRFPNLVAVQPFPAPEELRHAPEAIEAERFLGRLEEDLQNVLRPSLTRGEKTNAVFFFVASPWKRTVETWLRGLPATGAPNPVREVMERAKNHPELSAYVAAIPKYVQRVVSLVRAEGGEPPPAIDEVAVLHEAEGYLSRRFHFNEVEVYPEDRAEEYDPNNRRERARPGRPAFYLVFRPLHVPVSDQP